MSSRQRRHRSRHRAPSLLPPPKLRIWHCCDGGARAVCPMMLVAMDRKAWSASWLRLQGRSHFTSHSSLDESRAGVCPHY
eukprot:24431-Eustigmatos_ZCMA.PRE.1